MFSGSDQSTGNIRVFVFVLFFINTILSGHAGELQSAGIVKEKSA